MNKKETIERIIECVRGYIEGANVTYNYEDDKIKIDDNDIDFHFTLNITSQIKTCQLLEDESYLINLCQNICCNYMGELF